MDRVAAVNHPVVANIDTYMGCPRGIVGALEENEVAGTDIGRRHSGADVQQSGRPQSANIPAHAAVVEHIGHKAGTVKAGGG